MDCNKEEAIRAKELAEKKLQNKDFQGARKIALRAQQLYAGLENVSQILMVCDIHCSAEKKFGGTEMDWYGILQLEHTADDATIKKQYRKFALQLHPDKNKFPGAEAAFKLVGEAQRILLDREKRRMHDLKRNPHPTTTEARGASFINVPSAKANMKSTNGVQNKFWGNFPGFKPQQMEPPVFQTLRPTFWTVCPFCSVRYQYYREFVNRSLSCQHCQKTFVAYDLNVPNVPPRKNVDSPKFHVQDHLPKQGGYSKVELASKGASTAKIRRPGVPEKTAFQNAAPSANNLNDKKRKRKIEEESSESVGSESSSESEEEPEIIAENGQFNQSSDQPVRRSARQRQQVFYKDNVSDDDDDSSANHFKRAKGKEQPDDQGIENSSVEGAAKPTSVDIDDEEHEEQKPSGGSEDSFLEDDTENLGMETEENSDALDYPDPEFNDFDKDRLEECFAVGQIWAVFDTLDGMPRFYARIRRVFSPDFKLKITWLEPNPEKKDEKMWVEKKLPVSCGRFESGESEETKNRLMFSHTMHFEQCSQKRQIIYPIVGETWAIFKGWDIKWYSDPDDHKKFEYEFVEILSEYTDEAGVQIAYLRKVKGFASLFVQASGEGSVCWFCPEELFKFSHRVPSFRLTGEERGGVPKGCFELDPASIPLDVEEIDLSSEHVARPEVATCRISSQNEEPIKIPDSEFHNFDESKSPEKFQVDQVWAVYCDEDGLPKYYCQIVNVDTSPQFKLHVRWLDLRMLPNDATAWEDKKMPTSCGKFKLRGGAPAVYTTTNSFSHLTKAECGNSGLFEIFPEKGEVWALYRSWNPRMRCSDLESCQYDLVEVIQRDYSMVKVLVLERMAGFDSVFRRQVQGTSKVIVMIPMAGILKFSHQVPAVRLAEERNGSLRGCWELDTAALPVYFFGSK